MVQAVFYILAVITVVATILAVSAKHAVHAIIYLVTGFFALAIVFYLLGAPLLAVFEIIIYAGAIMVLFLFVIMTLDLGHPEKVRAPAWRDWWPALLLAGFTLAALAMMLIAGPAPFPGGQRTITIHDFSLSLFGTYGVAVEVISMQLLFALVGALYLGRRRGGDEVRDPGTEIPGRKTRL